MYACVRECVFRRISEILNACVFAPVLPVSAPVTAAGPRHPADGGARRSHPRLALGQEHGPHGDLNGGSRYTAASLIMI